MVFRIVGGALQTLDDMTRSGQIGVADSEADNVDAFARDLLFQAVKLGEQVGR